MSPESFVAIDYDVEGGWLVSRRPGSGVVVILLAYELEEQPSLIIMAP